MKVTGIIAEYNPFHNGHKYHLDMARSLTGADYLIVVMSGDYTQRGLPAIADKYVRTQMALENGADLVLELPLPFAVGSAEYFSAGSVALLNRLGIVDSLCFGSECGEIAPLSLAAELLINEPDEYRLILREHLSRGLSFPVARKNALLSFFPDSPNMESVLSSPNNILGIEYIKSILRQHSSIKPVTLQRAGAGYHEKTLTESYSSATAIRRALLAGTTPNELQPHVPKGVYQILAGEQEPFYPLFPEDFSLLLHYRLLLESSTSLTGYLDVSEDLANKIMGKLSAFSSFPDFCDKLKSKELTHSRISRSLLHILLNLTDEDMLLCRELDYAPYARVLGLSKDAGPLLNAIKKNTTIPLISKLADSRKLLSKDAFYLLEKEITASHLYEAVISHKYHTVPRSEYTRKILVL